jgi:hypothetical protein
MQYNTRSEQNQLPLITPALAFTPVNHSGPLTATSAGKHVPVGIRLSINIFLLHSTR